MAGYSSRAANLEAQPGPRKGSTPLGMIASSSKIFIMIHLPSTGRTTVTYTFGPHSDMIAKYSFLGHVLDTAALRVS